MFSNKNISKNRKNTFLGSHKALNDFKNESANFAIVLNISTKFHQNRIKWSKSYRVTNKVTSRKFAKS